MEKQLEQLKLIWPEAQEELAMAAVEFKNLAVLYEALKELCEIQTENPNQLALDLGDTY